MNDAASIGLFRSPAEFRSFSMDRYASSIAVALREAAWPAITIEEFCPPRRRAHGLGRAESYWSRYPRYWHHVRRTAFAVNHVLDHAYGHLTYALPAGRTIVTCHDLFPLHQWRGTIAGLPRRRTRPVTFRLSLSGLRRARFVAADSQATKDQLVELVELDPGRIHVVAPGIDPSFGPGERSREPRDQATILCVSTGAPYKNHHGTVEVLARVAARHERSTRLVRVGPPLALEDSDRLRRYGLADRVIELGHISESALADLYRSADVLLHPSLYEGFGWPPLEAMASGLPVVTSNWASLREVAGGAALHADALDYDGLADQVLSVLDNDHLAGDLRRRGQERAKQFSWTSTAERMLELYEAILGESGSSGYDRGWAYDGALPEYPMAR